MNSQKKTIERAWVYPQGPGVYIFNFQLSSFIYRINDNIQYKIGRQIALLVWAEQSYETITMKIKNE